MQILAHVNTRFLSILALLGALAGCAGTVRPGVAGAETDQDRHAAGEQDLSRGELMYRLLVAEVARQKGQLDVSVEYLMSALEQVDSPQIAEYTTQVAIYAQQYPQAYAAAQRWVALVPEDVDANQVIALLALRQDQPEEALGYLRHMLELLKEDEQQGFLLIASLLGREGKNRSETAMNIMGRLRDEYPNSAYAHFAYANLAAVFEKLEPAKQSLATALSLQPDYAPALILHARILRELGEVEVAIDELAAAVKRHPGDTDLRTAYARMLLTAKRYPEARDQYEILLENAPDDADLIYTLALLNLDIDELDRAVVYFQKLLKMGEHLSESYYFLGRTAEVRRQYKEAINHYFKVNQEEYRFDAQVRIAHLLAQLGQIDEGRRHLQILREQNSNPDTRVRLYLEEALVLEEHQQHQASITLLNDALQVYPGNTELLYTRGLSYEKVDRIDLLELDMRAVIEREPENADALNALGYTLADRTNRYQEAYELIERAMQLKPNNAAITDSMGWILYRMGRYQEALPHLRNALNLQFDAEIAAHLGEVLWITGDRKAAEAIFKQALEQEPNDKTLLNVMQQLKIGRFRQ
jgi:tetratricopeptide (TPR) repeat protein